MQERLTANCLRTGGRKRGSGHSDPGDEEEREKTNSTKNQSGGNKKDTGGYLSSGNKLLSRPIIKTRNELTALYVSKIENMEIGRKKMNQKRCDKIIKIKERRKRRNKKEKI